MPKLFLQYFLQNLSQNMFLLHQNSGSTVYTTFRNLKFLWSRWMAQSKREILSLKAVMISNFS